MSSAASSDAFPSGHTHRRNTRWRSLLTNPLAFTSLRLAVSFTRGVFSAQTELAFTARTEAHYQIKFATDAQLFGKNSYCEFWIVDLATGEQALAPHRVPLLRSEQAK